jgi:hypothetical protein
MPNEKAKNTSVEKPLDPRCCGRAVLYFVERAGAVRAEGGGDGSASRSVVDERVIPPIPDSRESGCDATAPQCPQKFSLSEERRPQFWHSMPAS